MSGPAKKSSAVRQRGVVVLAVMAISAACTSPLVASHDSGRAAGDVDANMASNAFVQVSVGRDVSRAQLCGPLVGCEPMAASLAGVATSRDR